MSEELEHEALGVLGQLLKDDDYDDHDDDAFRDEEIDAAAMAPAIHWPTVADEDRVDLMVELWEWVEELQRRFPEMPRLPKCWPLHNSLVELLQATKDHERSCFSAVSPPGAAVTWHLTLRDVEARMATFMASLQCSSGFAANDLADSHPEPQKRAKSADSEALNLWVDRN